MKREILLDQLIRETREATTAYYAYMYTDREYIVGEKIHLREAHFLLNVGRKGCPSMSDIAEMMDVSQGAVTQLAHRLFKKKLIEKEEDSADRRCKRIRLTEEGKRVYQAYCQDDTIRKEAIEKCVQCFSDDELRSIIRYEQVVQQICAGELAQDTLIKSVK